MPPEEQIKKLQQQVNDLQFRLDRLDRNSEMLITKDIELPVDIGVKIGTSANQKLGFWGNTPVVQFSSPTGRSDTSGSSGVNMTTGHQFNGNTGTDYYSVGDIVLALKTAGILKNQ